MVAGPPAGYGRAEERNEAMYRKLGTCERCGAPFSITAGVDDDCTYCGSALPNPLVDANLGHATLHQLLAECTVRRDWHAVLETIATILRKDERDPRCAGYLHFAGLVACNELNDEERGVAFFREEIVADGRGLRAHAAIAESFVRRQLWQLAEEELRAGLRRALDTGAKPEAVASLWDALGALHRDQLGDPVEAQECFDHAKRQRARKL